MKLTLRAPDDFHVHLRQPPLLEPVVRATADAFARVLVMPNTVPPVSTPELLRSYRQDILASLRPDQRLDLLMTFKLLPGLAPEDVDALAAAGAVGGKLYPAGVTTNAEDGVTDVRAIGPILSAMEARGLVLEVHGERPGAFVLDREEAFLPDLEWIVARHPRLRVVLEHVSSAAAVRAVVALPETVAATVTLHHLMITLDDVIGDELRPHHFCKPVAKREEDRDALLEAIFSGDGRFFFGSDSAPHPVNAKEAACGCAGIYTAPVAIPALVELFQKHGVPLAGDASPAASTTLDRFLSVDGARFYGLPSNEGTVTLREQPWTVPERMDGIVPFLAGEQLQYTLVPRGGG